MTFPDGSIDPFANFPREIMFGDIFVVAFKKRLIVLKDLRKDQYTHYTFVISDNFFDFHKTIEEEKKHIPILHIEFDWELLISYVLKELKDRWQEVIQLVRVRSIAL